MSGGERDRETATTQVKEVETATGQQGGVQLGGQLWPSGQWQMRPVVVVGGTAAPEKAASILWPPSHTQWGGGHQAVAVQLTLHNFVFHVKDKSGLTGNIIIEFLYSDKSSVAISAVPGNKVLHLAVLSHVQHEGGVAGPLACQAL